MKTIEPDYNEQGGTDLQTEGSWKGIATVIIFGVVFLIGCAIKHWAF
jgi:hypothetical protein